MKIIRANQSIAVKILDAIFYLRPLTFSQKIQLQSIWENITKDKGQEVKLAFEATRLALKFSLVKVENIKDEDEQEYSLSYDSEGLVSDNCIDDIFNLPITNELTSTVMSLINGIPDKIHNPVTGEVLENVTILSKKKTKAI